MWLCWLQSEGIAAFVLNYRVAGSVHSSLTTVYLSVARVSPDMMEDVSRSLQIVRENANKYGFPMNRIGVDGIFRRRSFGFDVGRVC